MLPRMERCPSVSICIPMISGSSRMCMPHGWNEISVVIMLHWQYNTSVQPLTQLTTYWQLCHLFWLNMVFQSMILQPQQTTVQILWLHCATIFVWTVCVIDCTVLETAWRDTKYSEPDAAAYETAISELWRFVKQSTVVQERLLKSLSMGATRGHGCQCTVVQNLSILAMRHWLHETVWDKCLSHWKRSTHQQCI